MSSTVTDYTEEPNINDEEAIDTSYDDIQGSPADSHRIGGFPLLPPGIYLSSTRTLKHSKEYTKDGVPYMKVEVAFAPFLTESGDAVKQRPPFCRLNTIPRKDGGLTSLADYLAAFGVDARLLSGSSLVEAVEATQDQPVLVRTGIKEDWRSVPAGEKAKKDEFFLSPDGKYLSEAQDSSGRLVKGWAEVYGFRKYKTA